MYGGRLTDTRLIDAECVYDLKLVNGRLLLASRAP
jgi:hypothetical protein